MSIRLLIAASAVCLLFCACGRTEERSIPDTAIVLDIKTFSKEPPSGIEYGIVALETPSNALIGSVKSLYVSQGAIYLFDANSNFFVFDRDGKFRFRSQPRGRGPKEFMSISQYAVDPQQGDLLVYDNMLSKVLIFDQTGKCSKELHNIDGLFADATEIAYTDNGKLLANLRFAPDISHYYATFSPNDKFRTDRLLLKYPYRWKELSSEGSKPKIARNKTGMHMVSMLSDTIYTLTPTGALQPEYIINSGMKSIAQLNPPTDLDNYFDLMQFVGTDKKITRGVRNILTTDRLGYTGLFYYDDCLNHIFWDLATGQGCIFPQQNDDTDILSDLILMWATEDSFVGMIYPDTIDEELLRQDTRFAHIKNLKADDNPIVVFCKVRL